MNVPLLDLTAQYRSLKDELLPELERLFESQQFILGPAVEACEKDLARYCGCAHAVGVSSGTDALLLALMAEGIGPGDEVITTPYTFFATAGCIVRLGAKPVFVDIDPVTCNLLPECVEQAITPRTQAILPVHLYGQMAAMDPLVEMARRRGLAVIEDACQAIGSEDAKGRRAGSVGDYGCFSFFPSKNLGVFGDGGLLTTQDPARAEKLVRLRNHGMHPKYYHATIGGNFRLDALQALVARIKLRHLDAWTAARQSNAARYDRLLRAAGLADPEGREMYPTERFPVVTPRTVPGRHIFHQYVIRVLRRDALRAHLQAAGIGCEIYYPVPLHRQECFAYLGYKAGDFPESERAAVETLALPVFPELSDAQAEQVVNSLRQFFANA